MGRGVGDGVGAVADADVGEDLLKLVGPLEGRGPGERKGTAEGAEDTTMPVEDG